MDPAQIITARVSTRCHEGRGRFLERSLATCPVITGSRYPAQGGCCARDTPPPSRDLAQPHFRKIFPGIPVLSAGPGDTFLGPFMSTIPQNDPLWRARAGSVEAFGELVNLHEGWVRALLRGRLKDWSAADDLAQEVFVTAFRKIRQFRGDGCLDAWLRGIAMNLLRNYKRKHREEYIGGSMELETLTSRRPQPMESAGPSLEALGDCLAELGGDVRDLLEKRYVQGVSVKELSQRTGRGYSALTMQFHRLREILAECIEAKLEEAKS